MGHVTDWPIIPSVLCQFFFILSTATIIFIQALPKHVRRSLMDYGARRPAPLKSSPSSDDGFEALITGLTNYGQVPHSWFYHFYILSVASSLFWAWQFGTGGRAFKVLAEWEMAAVQHEQSFDAGRVYVAWAMMASQGLRRLYESLVITRPGSSPMWFVHWALGLAYYAFMGISVWIESSGPSEFIIPSYANRANRL